MNCFNCNNQISDDAKFCKYCGSNLENKNISQEKKDSQNFQDTNGNKLNNDKDLRNKKNNIIWKVLLVLCVVLLIGVALFLILSGGIFKDSGVSISETSIETISDINAETSDEIEKIIEEADKYLLNNNYEKAILTLENGISKFPNSSEISNKIDEVKKEKELSDLNTLIEKEEYKAALEYISAYMSQYRVDSDVEQIKNECVEKYRTLVINDAKNALEKDGYEKAISIIKDALEVLPNDEVLTDELNKYKEYTPVKVSDVTIMGGNAGWVHNYDPDEYTDARNKVYTDAIMAGGQEYYTEGKYKKITAVFEPSIDFPTTYDYGVCKIEIYADDKLVYSSDELTYKTKNLKVDVDIDNAEYVRIDCVDISKYGSYSGFFFFHDAYFIK